MTTVNLSSRLPSRPAMRTFWPAAKSDAPPCTSKQLFISAPYQSAMRCGTKKTKISFGGTLNSRTNSRLAIEGSKGISQGEILKNFHKDKRHIVRRRAVAPLGDEIENSLLHLFKREKRSFANNFLHAFYAEHIAARIENVRNPVGIEHDAVSCFQGYVESGFRAYRVRKRAQNHAARFQQSWLGSGVRDHTGRMACSSKEQASASPIQLRCGNSEKENGTPNIVHDETIQLPKHRRKRRAVAKLGHRFSINAVSN